MADANEGRPSRERTPAEALYNGSCDFLLVMPGGQSTYAQDAHYHRIALDGEGQGVVALIHDYYASRTKHWDYTRADDWGSHPVLQRELLQSRQTVISVEFEGSDPAHQAKYMIFRPNDLNPRELEPQNIIYGYDDVKPGITPGTYDPDEILVVTNVDGTYRQVADPLQEPLLADLIRQML